MAASYGLLQTIPESARTYIYGASLSVADEQALLDAYNPRVDNTEALFDPELSSTFGALFLAAEGTPEFRGLDQELVCTQYPSECTWERLWKRRLRVYNSGKEDMRSAAYADKIINLSQQMLPE